MITAIVLTKNEQRNLPRCLESLTFCDHILVIDDSSTDRTASLAASFGAKVVTHPLSADFSSQRNFALQKVTSGWVLFVDADEQVTPELASEIKNSIVDSSVDGFAIKRIDSLWGNKLKYGDFLGFKIVRLAKYNAGIWKGKVHETWHITGKTGTLKNHLLHYPHSSISDFLQSLNQYSSIRARELYSSSKRSSIAQVVTYPIAKFIYLYILKLGFMDGTAGIIHALNMSFYSFLVRSKLYLLKKGLGEYE